MASITSEIASSSSLPQGKCEVFLSFRGQDTRNNFTDHLYVGLNRRGIGTFRDEERLERGTNISTQLLNVIEESKFAIVILSRNFASSSWCLDELVKIVKCMEETRQTVLPIFYGVDPSDVRNQRGSFAEAFAIHEECNKNEERLKSWRAALTRVANLCGWDTRNEIESMLIGRVIEDIINKRIPTNLIISIYPLRYDICHEYLKLFLQVGSKDVIILGICGPRRMGKTAIAKVIYSQIFYTFQGSSFLSDVAQNSKQPNGLVNLQEKLLSDVLSERDIAIANCTRGMDIIKEKLCSKRVLIVLDDVDDLEQLYALIGSRNWFGVGSKVIITTKKVHLLNVLGVDQILLAQGRPLPPNIEDIWEKYQQSCHIVAGFQEYIQSLYNMRNDRVRYLENCLLKERQENAVQAPPTG